MRNLKLKVLETFTKKTENWAFNKFQMSFNLNLNNFSKFQMTAILVSFSTAVKFFIY